MRKIAIVSGGHLSPDHGMTQPSTFLGVPGQVGKTIAKKLCPLEIPATPRKSFYET